MKIRYLIFAGVLLFCFAGAAGQDIMKGKHLKRHLLRLDSLISSKEYEKAILLFESKSATIVEEEIPPKLSRLYFSSKMVVADKKRIFEDMKLKVAGFDSLHRQKLFCKAYQLLNLRLDNENSYAETRELQTRLSGELVVSKQKCESYADSLKFWTGLYKTGQYEPLYRLLLFDENERYYFFEKDREHFDDLMSSLREVKVKSDSYSMRVRLYKEFYDKGEYETIYNILELDKAEKKYFLKEDLAVFEEIVAGLKETHGAYLEASEFFRKNPAGAVSEVDFLILKLDEAVTLADTLAACRARMEQKYKEVPGVNPKLEQAYKAQRAEIESKIKRLQKYIDEKELVKTTTFSNTNITSLSLDDFSVPLAYLQACPGLRRANKLMSADKLETDAKNLVDKIVVPNKKVLIHVDSLTAYGISSDSSNILSISFYADSGRNRSSAVTLELCRDYESANNRAQLTTGPVLEKLAQLPQDPAGMKHDSFTLLVQFVPLGWGLFGESKYYFMSPEAGIKIYAKVLDVY